MFLITTWRQLINKNTLKKETERKPQISVIVEETKENVVALFAHPDMCWNTSQEKSARAQNRETRIKANYKIVNYVFRSFFSVFYFI